MPSQIMVNLPSSTRRNFSRPFPSPLSTTALEYVTPEPYKSHPFTTTPLSAARSMFTPRTSSRNNPVANRIVNATPLRSPIRGINLKSNGSPRRPRWLQQHEWGNSKTSLSSFADSTTSDWSFDFGGPEKPIPNFRANLWRFLDCDREILNLDLFWPINLEKDYDIDSEDEEDRNVFPLDELRPLTAFHNLHVLQLNGMMRSYQPLIWIVCWLNRSLTELHLEMALEPVLSKESINNRQYCSIDGEWFYKNSLFTDIQLEYLGAHGTGVLHEEFGTGEYLDYRSMQLARSEISLGSWNNKMRHLTITHLTLMNFVVDAGPFFRWFNPKTFRQITFLNGCIDAGFALPQSMQGRVRINSPKPKLASRMIKPGEVTIIEVRNASEALHKTDKKESNGSNGLKNKLSQMIPRWGLRSRDESGLSIKEKDTTLESRTSNELKRTMPTVLSEVIAFD